MKKTDRRITEMQPEDLRLECSPNWDSAPPSTQSVAFRVTGIRDDSEQGRIPIWEACPLTEEEEEILRGLRLSN
ncbi:MAG TPA: hypothetical protein VMU28_10270 [Terriglobales bacterium]|nr:hypothetical protein [Terriglobales bacterium]